MGRLADRLDSIRVHTRAPGAEIEAELRNRTEITLEFGESVYEFISEPAMENALAGIARLLWAGWQRQYRAAIADTNLHIEPDDLHDYNFFAERDQIESVGEAGDGRITISAVGMNDFSVRIKPGALREISEQEFASRATEAAGRLIEDYRDKVNEVKARYYG